jgi:hypothetical protein
MSNKCRVCGSEATLGSLQLRCSYCGESVCGDHRLPEAHDCTGNLLPPGRSPVGDDTPQDPSVSYNPDSTTAERAIERWASDQGVSVDVEPLDSDDLGPLPGTTPEFEGAPSPDVNPDGSIATEEDGDEGDRGTQSLLDRLLPWRSG